MESGIKRLGTSFIPRFCDMEGYGSSGKSRTVTPKTLKFVPMKTAELMKQLESESMRKPRNFRKQLFSDKKEQRTSKRFSTTMKPNKQEIRKTTYHKESTSRPVPKYFSDKSFSLIKQSLPPKFNEKRNTNYSIPKIVINDQNTILFKKPAIPQKVQKTTRLTMMPEKTEKVNKIEPIKETNEITVKQKPPNSDKLNEIHNKLNEIYNKVNSFETKFDELLKRLEQLELKKCKNCKIAELTETKEDNSNKINTPDVNDLINEAINDIDEKKFKPTQLFKSKVFEEINKSPPRELKKPNDKLLESLKKCNKFELLESKCKNGSPMSDEFSLSYTDSPIVFCRDITWLLDEDTEKPTTSQTIKPKKSVSFLPKSEKEPKSVDLMYNEIRDNVKFLCTPKKTNSISNLMTPSAKSSKNKMISRRVQEQLLLLN